MINPENKSKRTTDHEEIKQWVENHNGKPAIVSGTQKDDGGVLRIDFGGSGRSLEGISWELFFSIFDKNELAFLYQDTEDTDKLNRFNKFVPRDREAGGGEKKA